MMKELIVALLSEASHYAIVKPEESVPAHSTIRGRLVLAMLVSMLLVLVLLLLNLMFHETEYRRALRVLLAAAFGMSLFPFLFWLSLLICARFFKMKD